jgi:NAD(P)-dependent dehydrogenase (short-subunit alcohol dehydrogenase family)
MVRPARDSALGIACTGADHVSAGSTPTDAHERTTASGARPSSAAIRSLAIEVSRRGCSSTANSPCGVSIGTVRISVDVHGGPAADGRLLNKEGEPHKLEDFRLTLESCLISPFNVTRLAAAAISKSAPFNEDGTRGVISQAASVAGFEGQIGQLAYGAAKGGIISMTLIAARDLSPVGIRVVTIAPGTILTPAYGQAGDKLQAYWGPQIPHPKRMGHADEYAQLAVAIAENDYLNGEVIRLDGALRFPPR